MMHWQRGSLVFASVVALAACSDALPTGPGEDDARFRSPNTMRGIHGEFSRLAEEIPGFGGIYYAADGRMHVVVARGTTTPAAVRRALSTRAAIGLTVLAKVGASAEQIVVQEGDYDYLELSRWHEQARPVLGMEGVVFTDVDETQNRLRIGVMAAASLDAVRATLANAGVPAEAVAYEVTEPIVPLAGNTLRQRVQPLAGGLQLVFPNPMPGFVSLCTLGFNVLREEPGPSRPYFMTNSHCSRERGVVDETPYHQQPVAVLDPDYLIGFEVVDPPFFTDPLFCPYAPSGFVCRFSDAALARYVPRRTTVRFGSIYRTARFGTTSPGSIEFGSGDPRFFSIVEEVPFPLVGEVLDKVGRTTGWTRGPVVGTCIDTGVSGTNIAMLCQDFVQAAIAGGDSGSPVFQQIGDGRNARLYGILWGGGGALYVFSAMENIHFELGEFRTH